LARGGKREGSGRKPIGISKRVALTLTEDEWSIIEQSEQSISSFVRHLIAENCRLQQSKKKITKGEGNT
jgi:hypothetical protein